MQQDRRTPKQMWMSVFVMLVLAGFYFYNAYKQAREADTPVTPQPAVESTLVVNLPGASTVQPTGALALPVSADADFDYYVLSLSWSPDYCATDGSDDTQQCSLGRKLAFVLHGLWPQYENGYPSYCSEENFPSSLKQEYPNLYPNTSLYTHEWEKHGTCSGLSPEDFLILSKAVKESVVIPAAYQSPAEPFRVTLQQVKDAFTTANPSISEDGLAVMCSGSGRFLSELRVCFSLDGQPRACSTDVLKDASKSCARADFLVRNVK